MSAGTFSAIGNVSASVAIDQDDGLSITLTNTGGNLWTVVLEESIGNASWRLMATYSSDQSATVVTPRLSRMMIVRLRAATILTGDTIAYTLTRISNQDGVTLTLADGVPVIPALAVASAVTLYQTTVSFTNAQIKAAPGGVATEGVTQVLPAPGANKVIIPLQIITRSNFTVAYTNIGVGGQLAFVIGADVSDYSVVSTISRGTTVSNTPTGFLDDGEHLWFWGTGIKIEEIGTSDVFVGIPNTTEVSTVVDQPLQFYAYNVDGDYTGGNAANTLAITVMYAVVDV